MHRPMPFLLSLLVLNALVLALLLPACARKPAARAPGPVRAVVTIPPLAGLLKPLLPADSRFTMLMAPGKSEHGYEFSPSDVAALADADLVLYVGLGLEAPVERFLNRNRWPGRREVCLGVVLGMQELGKDPHDHADHHHDHSHDHDHDHGDVDPHVWLDPLMMIAVVDAAADAVRDAARAANLLTPAESARISSAQAQLKSRLIALDNTYGDRLAPFKGAAIVTHHAAFGWLAKRYELRVAEVIRHVEAAEPTPGQLAEVVAAIKRENVPVIFVEPQYDAAAAERIARLAGVRLGVLDPLGDGDYFVMMERNLDALVRGLAGEPAGDEGGQ